MSGEHVFICGWYLNRAYCPQATHAETAAQREGESGVCRSRRENVSPGGNGTHRGRGFRVASVLNQPSLLPVHLPTKHTQTLHPKREDMNIAT